MKKEKEGSVKRERKSRKCRKKKTEEVARLKTDMQIAEKGGLENDKVMREER